VTEQEQLELAARELVEAFVQALQTMDLAPAPAREAAEAPPAAGPGARVTPARPDGA